MAITIPYYYEYVINMIALILDCWQQNLKKILSMLVNCLTAEQFLYPFDVCDMGDCGGWVMWLIQQVAVLFSHELATWRFVCQQNLGLYRRRCLAPCFIGTIYDHPTTRYEQFIERYYGRHKGSGQSKATVISDGQVILLDIRCDVWGEGRVPT